MTLKNLQEHDLKPTETLPLLHTWFVAVSVTSFLWQVCAFNLLWCDDSLFMSLCSSCYR